MELETSAVGSLQLYGDAAVKFSESCQNAIIETDSQPKTEIQVRIQPDVCLGPWTDKLENVSLRIRVFEAFYAQRM